MTLVPIRSIPDNARLIFLGDRGVRTSSPECQQTRKRPYDGNFRSSELEALEFLRQTGQSQFSLTPVKMLVSDPT
jgi:hypothetical protein